MSQGATGISETLSRDTSLGDDPGTMRSLKQIAEVLLLDPKIRMRINFVAPNKLGPNLTEKNQQAVENWNKAKFEGLARYLQRSFGINPSRLSYSQEGKGGQLIFFKK